MRCDDERAIAGACDMRENVTGRIDGQGIGRTCPSKEDIEQARAGLLLPATSWGHAVPWIIEFGHSSHGRQYGPRIEVMELINLCPESPTTHSSLCQFSSTP